MGIRVPNSVVLCVSVSGGVTRCHGNGLPPPERLTKGTCTLERARGSHLLRHVCTCVRPPVSCLPDEEEIMAETCEGHQRPGWLQAEEAGPLLLGNH